VKPARLDLVHPDLEERSGRIIFLLSHWQDFFETAARDDGPTAGECPACAGWYSKKHTCGTTGVYLLPGMSRHRSVVELGRALGELRYYAPGCSAHLFGYYGSPFRTALGWREVRVKGRKRRIEMLVLERVLPSWVELRRVEAGVLFVAQKPRSSAESLLRPWCFRGNPKIPAPLLAPMPKAGSSDEPVAA